MQRVLILIFAVFCLSTSVVFIKSSTMPPALMAAGRLLLAAAFLLPVFLRDLGHLRRTGQRLDFREVLVPAFWFGGHFISWIYGARLIPAAHSSLIINLVPVVMPFLLLAMARERVDRAQIVGTVFALGGGTVLAISDYRFHPEHLRGDLICLGSMLCYSVYLTLARRNRHFPSIWLYMAPLYAAAGIMCLAASIATERARWFLPGLEEWRLLLGLTLVPTVIGHTLLANAMRHFPGQTVALFNLGQFIFAGAMAVPVFLETPRTSFYLASGLIVIGAAVSLAWKHPALRSPANPAAPVPAGET